MHNSTPKRTKRVRYTRRAQRRHRAQKMQREAQRRFQAAGTLDRADQRVGIARWQQQRVTLSQLIVPSEGHSRQKQMLSDHVKIQREAEQTCQQKPPTKTAQKKAQKEARKLWNAENGNGFVGEKPPVPAAKIAALEEEQMNGKKSKGKNNDRKLAKMDGNEQVKTVAPMKKCCNGNANAEAKVNLSKMKAAEAAGKTHDLPANGLQQQDIIELNGMEKQQRVENGFSQGNGGKKSKNLVVPVKNAKKEKKSVVMEGGEMEAADCKNFSHELSINIDTAGNATACEDRDSGIMLLQEEEHHQNDIEAPLTICSVDSGVDMGNGNGDQLAQEMPFNSESPKCTESQDVAKRHKQQEMMGMAHGANNSSDNTNGNISSSAMPVTKFEQRVYELMDQVQERIHVQSTMLAANEQLAPLLMPLKVEPLNLERIKSVAIVKRERRPRMYRLLDSDIQYCQYMEQNYGNDYEAMSRDPRNLFGDSADSMSRKLRIYKDFLKQQNTADGVAAV